MSSALLRPHKMCRCAHNLCHIMSQSPRDTHLDLCHHEFLQLKDIGVVEAQRVQEEVIAHCKHNVEMLTNEMTELKTILAAITMKYKVAEDARKVMYKRNSILMDDNAFLQQKLKETELQRIVTEKAKILAERELKDNDETIKRLETALKEIISEGLLDKKKRRALLVRERATSTTDIPAIREMSPDGSDVAHADEDYGQTEAERPLEEDDEEEPENVRVETVKNIEDRAAGDYRKGGKTHFRETAPARALDRVRHAKLVKVSQELERLKHMNSWKTSELGIKSRELKIKDAELADAKKEILVLKNKLNQNLLSKKRMNAKKWIENAAQKRIAFKPIATKKEESKG